MADIAIFRINYKSDFILTLQSDAGWLTPFCIKFWTGAPSQAYFVGYDGTTYTHCAPVDGDPTRLTVQFDNHNLPIGNLKFQIAYHFTVADFPNDTEDEVINPASIIIEIDGTPHQVMLDFQGETAPEIEFSLPAYANEAQRIANEEERERIFAEMQSENAEAVECAENVNAELSGTVLTVTNRNGNSTSVNTKGEPGIGIPAGGTTNQVLVKESDSDYDVKWRNAPASGVSSVNGKYGDVVLNATDVGAQPVIPDLSEIRSGAAKGSTAYQKPSSGIPKSDMAAGVQSSLEKADTALQQSDLTPIENDIDAIEAKIPSAASASNQLADKNFVNSSIATNTATFKGTYNSLAELQAVTGATNNDYGFVIEYDEQGNEYYDRYKYNGTAWVFEYKIESTPFTAAQWAAIQSGITSGDVAKLAALPTKAQLDALLDAKQDVINDLATIRSGASAGATAYQKPSGGIPQSDLSSAVQTSLGKADTALQSYNETDPVFSASPAAGITSNDITEWDGKAEPTPVVNHGTSDTTFSLTPNVFHVWGTVTSLTLTLATPADTTIINEYMVAFTSGSTATTLSLPSSVEWAESCGSLSVEASKTYQISIVNNIALWAAISNS